jgi:hypothetical protein
LGGSVTLIIFLLTRSPLFATHRLQHATSSLPPPTIIAIPRIAQPALPATAVAIPQSSHSPQLPSTPALSVCPPALLSTLASLATSHPQPHIIPAFSSLSPSLPPPAVTVRSSIGLSRGGFGPQATWTVARDAAPKSSYIGLFSTKKSNPKYNSAQKCGPKDLLLAPIEPGAGGLPQSLKLREHRLFQLFRKPARLCFLYCQRRSRLHSVLYRSPRLQALQIRQGHKAATSEAAGRALTQASATTGPASTSTSSPLASL